MKTYTDAAECKKREMDVVAFFVSDAESAMSVQPRDGALNVPAKESESAAVFGVASCNQRAHLSFEQFYSVRVGIIRAVGDDEGRPFARTARFAGYRRDGVDEGDQLGDVMLVGTGDGDGKGNPLPIRDDVVFGTRFAPIRWIRARLGPPKTARTLDESTIARDQSIRSAPLSRANNTAWSPCHTPLWCHDARRRQHVIPHPQPISWGSNSHGIPVRSTNRIPNKAMRLGIAGRPLVLGGLSGGRSGSMRFHSSSGKIARAISSSLQPTFVKPNPLALCKSNRHNDQKTLGFVRGFKGQFALYTFQYLYPGIV